MRILYLLRHGKSSWDDSSLYDFNRPLNARGLRETKEMALYFKNKNYIPNLILCSNARRTRETLEPILEEIDFNGEVIYKDSLYLASANQIRFEVENAESESLLLVGHNYGIEEFLNSIVPEYLEMKTCHLAVIDMENNKLIDFVRPKEF